MYAYRLGIALMIAAIYVLTLGCWGSIDFLIIASLIAVIVGLILAIGGAGSAKYDEEQRHRELMEALGRQEGED